MSRPEQRMVEAVLNIRGVNSAALMGADGGVLASAGGRADAGLARLGRDLAAAFVSGLGEGELRDLVLDFEDGPTLLTALGGRTLLTAFDDVANLGRLRYALKRAAAELESKSS